MLNDSSDREFITNHMFESILATIMAIVLIALPFVLIFIFPERGEEAASDLSFLSAMSVLLIIFRTPDIFTARKRLKELVKTLGSRQNFLSLFLGASQRRLFAPERDVSTWVLLVSVLNIFDLDVKTFVEVHKILIIRV